MRSKWARIAAAGAGLLVSAEVVLRFVVGLGDPPVAVLDDAIEYYPQPGGVFSRFGNAIVINRYGMRSADFEPGAGDAPRVLLLGDSVVYGEHHLDQAETIAARLAARGQPAAAIAASSWGPGNLLAYWQRFGPFTGNVAFLVQSAHDRTDVPFSDSGDIPYRTRPSVCALDDALQVALERTRGDRHRGGASRLSREESLASSERSLRELVVAVKAHVGRVVLVYHPTRSELRGESPTEASHFRQLAASLGVQFTSAFDDRAWAEDELDRLFDDDTHPSSDGARFIADHLLETINGAPASRARSLEGAPRHGR